MRVRLSTDRRSTDSYTRDYSYSAQAPTSAVPRVFVGADGTAHDPDFLSHILSEHKELARRRAISNRRAKRLSQTGLVYTSDSEDEDEEYRGRMDDDAPDPFRTAATHRTAQSYYVDTPAMQARRERLSGNAPRRTSITFDSQASSPSFRYLTSSPASTPLLEEESDMAPSASPSDRWSIKRWSRKLEDVPEHSGKPNTLKKKEPEQPPLVFQGDEDADDETPMRGDDQDEVPTCSEALRRQWQAIVVRVMLSTHRAKRRLRPKKRDTHLYNEKFGT
jgi:hypothetical protein